MVSKILKTGLLPVLDNTMGQKQLSKTNGGDKNNFIEITLSFDFFEISFSYLKYSVISKYFFLDAHFSSCSINNAPISRMPDSLPGIFL